MQMYDHLKNMTLKNKSLRNTNLGKFDKG